MFDPKNCSGFGFPSDSIVVIVPIASFKFLVNLSKLRESNLRSMPNELHVLIYINHSTLKYFIKSVGICVSTLR